jgi:hypothetical protein
MQESVELGIDELLFDSEVDPVLRAINTERARIKAKFDPLIKEISEQDIDIAGINTLSDAAGRMMVVRGYYHRVQAIFGEVLIEKRLAQVRRDASKSKAAAKVAQLISSDPEVRGISGHQAQVARAESKAKSEIALAAGCSDLHLLVYGYSERVQASLDDLKFAAQDLREYVRTLRDAKALGESGVLPEGASTGREKWGM